MKQETNGNVKNYWKYGLLILLALNLSFLGVIASRVLQEREPEKRVVSNQTSDDFKIGQISTTKDQLNQTLATYLKDYQTSDLTYNIYISSKSILFEGTYKILGYDVPLYVYFEPYKLSSGAIQLKITSISAGTLPLPEKDVLKYINNTYDIPEFVEILPDEATINVNIQSMTIDNKIYLKATNLDLINDTISFDIYKKTIK
ncbi:YpmS family protein [Streptococcus sp. CSL10205-OR2]|uniref:YpmS family protein n=1 Tax=Streptococcus sp. CSL10205-OR2 TaxID=2980558 RepID=UPI0021D9AB6B|nr:YpmS family protein [Streptococcus sp. CSL10205-OR2]MCU9534269.1 YpmS family protein [Streptococcus sp. CSL10205-OR2]